MRYITISQKKDTGRDDNSQNSGAVNTGTNTGTMNNGSGGAIVNVNFPLSNEEKLKVPDEEEKRQALWSKEVHNLVACGVSRYLLTNSSLTDQAIADKSASCEKTKHAYKMHKNIFTSFQDCPITDEERSQYIWQARAVLELRKRFLPETKVSEDQLLNILVFQERNDECAKYLIGVQSIYRKT